MEDQYCRLCMAEENLCDINSSVRKCLKDEYSIEIRDNDELSKVICRECEESVSEVVKLQEKITKLREKTSANRHKFTKTQKLLQKILKTKDRSADSEFVTKDTPTAVEKHCPVPEEPIIEDLTKDDTNRCADSDAVKDTPIKVEKPCPVPEEPIVENLTEDDTNVSSSNDFILNKIIRSIDLDEVKRTENQMRITSNPENNSCTVCKIKVDPARFQMHLESSVHIFKAKIVEQSGDHSIFINHAVGYKCPFCPKVFTNKVALATHSKTEHKRPLNKNHLKPDILISKNMKTNKDNSVEKDYVVSPEFIVKAEPDSSEMAVSVNPISKLKAHPCIACNKSFGFAESLRRHQQKHHKGCFFCHHCRFFTTRSRTGSEHLRKCRNLSPYQRVCSSCFKVCKSISDLLFHRKKAHKIAIKHDCLLCNEKFPNTTLLKKHKRDVHRTPRGGEDTYPKHRFQCGECNQEFPILSDLKKHHCTTINFKCLKKCGKQFENYEKMERHAAKCNSGQTIYSCERCQKCLESLESLKMHSTKCLLKMPVPFADVSNAESAEKIQQTLEYSKEGIVASHSSPIQLPPADTNHKENLEPPIPSNLMDSSKTREQTSENSKQITKEDENIQSTSRLLEVPNSDITRQIQEVKLTPIDWRTTEARNILTGLIEEVILKSGMPTSQTSIEMERHLFEKAKTKDEYYSFMNKLILHRTEMNSNERGLMKHVQGNVPNVPDIQSRYPVPNFNRQNTPPSMKPVNNVVPSPTLLPSSNTVQLPKTPYTIGTMMQQCGPGNQSQPTPSPYSNDERAYRDKVKQLSRFIEPVGKMISRFGNIDNEIINSLKKILEILSSPNQRIPMRTLLIYEVALEIWESNDYQKLIQYLNFRNL